jgi:hypothetical protein
MVSIALARRMNLIVRLDNRKKRRRPGLSQLGIEKREAHFAGKPTVESLAIGDLESASDESFPSRQCHSSLCTQIPIGIAGN